MRPDALDRLEAPQGTFVLVRRPPPGRRPLRAWDAADEYLLDHLATRAEGGSTLVANDGFGALSVAMAAGRGTLPRFLTDSFVSVLATRENLERNGFGHHTLVVEAGPDALGGIAEDAEADLVVIKIPRSLGLLEDQLHRIRAVAHERTEVVAGVMSRHLQRSAVELFERIIGPSTVSLARKKARLVHAAVDPDLAPAAPSWPREYRLPTGGVVVNHAGVHSAGRLDPGTRFFLEHLPTDGAAERIVDLGCGDGAVAIAALHAHPHASVLGVDESYLAVASARATAERDPRHAGRTRFVVGDVLEDLESGTIEDASVDLVLVNPPFHADHAVGDDTAWRMFTQARRVLRPGGEIRVVGNRHLAYHAKLRRLFGNDELVASNPKFVVSRARRR